MSEFVHSMTAGSHYHAPSAMFSNPQGWTVSIGNHPTVHFCRSAEHRRDRNDEPLLDADVAVFHMGQRVGDFTSLDLDDVIALLSALRRGARAMRLMVQELEASR